MIDRKGKMEGSRRARQAAEALFTPKPEVTDRSAADSLPSADRSARKPPVLGAVAPLRHEAEASSSSEQQTTLEIPGRNSLASELR